ncbi:MAG: ABC transporter ATP-binding protein [Syntrophaceae bacterium]|nr:ABC transporter ATP-binding protein [Syntrophaceae bacterium]
MNSVSNLGLTCQGLCKTYQTKNGLISAIKDVSFCVKEHEFICIVGPSGCGKTTLLKLIAGLLHPTSGQIFFSQDPQDGIPRSALVFQEHGLFPWMTVLDNVAFGLEMRVKDKKERRDLSRPLIEKMGLLAFTNNYPHELSMGMRQRVGIARAFVSKAQILLMDEPLGSLDAQTKLILQEELLKIWKEDQKCVVYITHDIEEAIFLGDRLLVMTARPGHIREEIVIPFDRPRDLSIKELTEFAKMKGHIWRILEEEVRKSCG